MAADLLLLGLAFALGACLAHTSLCLVAALQAALVERRLQGLCTQLVALCTAGAVLTLLAAALPALVHLPAERGVSLAVIGGAAILGVGALVNGGCYLGSILYLGRGRSDFLFTLVGIAAASRIAPTSYWRSMQSADTVRSLMGDAPYLAAAVFAAVAAIVVVLALTRTLDGRRALVRAFAVAALTGGIAALLYARHTASHLAPVLETLKYLVHDTPVWTEITTLLIPTLNDSDDELHALCAWVARELGPDVPLHFTAFHPDYRMNDLPATPAATLSRARRIGVEEGLRYVYTGNVHDAVGGTTACRKCGASVVVRDWYRILEYHLTPGGHCRACHAEVAGRFERFTGQFGPRRVPVRITA